MSQIGEMIVKVGLTMDSFSKGMATVESRLDKFQRELKKTGRDLTEAITVPIVGIATVALRSSETAMAIFGGFKDRVAHTMGDLGLQIVKSLDLEAMLRKISDALASAVKWFSDLDESTKKTILTVAAMVAALGPLLIILEKFLSVVKFLVVAVAFLATPLGLAIGLITAAGLGTYELIKYFTDLDDKLKNSTKATDEQTAAFQRFLNATKQSGAFGLGMLGIPSDKKLKAAEAAAAPAAASPQAGGVPESVLSPAKVLAYNDALDRRNKILDSMFSKLQENSTEWGLNAGGINLVAANINTLSDSYKRLLAEGIDPASQGMVDMRTKIEELQTPWMTFMGLMMQVPPIAQQIGATLFTMVQSFAQGVGDAMAQVLVYGASLRDTMKALMKAIVATIISSLVAIVIQRVIAMVAGVAAQAVELIKGMTTYAALTYAAAFASTAAIPIVGVGLAPAAATEAVATMLVGAVAAGSSGAGAGAGIAAAETGGLFNTPGITRIAEKGRPEIVLNQDNVRKFMGGTTGGGRQSITVYLDSDVIISKVVRGMPEFLRLQGAI